MHKRYIVLIAFFILYSNSLSFDARHDSIQTLCYPAPVTAANSHRTVFLHSKGHYQVLRDPHGIPDVAGLYSFKKPGRFLEFSKQRFFKMYQMTDHEQER